MGFNLKPLRKVDFDRVFLKAVAKEVARLRSKPFLPDFRVTPLDQAFKDCAWVARTPRTKKETFRAAALACAMAQVITADALIGEDLG